MKNLRLKLKNWWQRRTRGYTDEDMFNLSTVMAVFIVSKLKAYKQHSPIYPKDMTRSERRRVLDDMIYAFFYANIDDNTVLASMDIDRIERGLSLFGQYYYYFSW